MAFDFTRLSFRDLYLLAAMCRTHSLAAAALEVGVTKPVASRMLADLRQLLGDRLFVRYASAMMPTPAMEALRPQIDEILVRISSLPSTPAFTPKRYAGLERIGCIDFDLLSRLVMRTAERWHRESPLAQLEFRLLDDSFAEKLAMGELDAAIWYTDALGPNFHCMKLQRTRPAVIVRKDHPLAREAASLGPCGRIPADRVAACPRIALTFRKSSSLFYFGFEARQSTVFYVPLISGALRLLLSDDYTLVMPRAYGADLLEKLGVVEIPVDDPPLRDASCVQYLVWHDRVHRHPAHQWLRSIFADEARRLAEEGAADDPGAPRL